MPAKKALIIGINYIGQPGTLKGCINDAWNVAHFIVNNYGFQPADIRILTDNPQAKHGGLPSWLPPHKVQEEKEEESDKKDDKKDKKDKKEKKDKKDKKEDKKDDKKGGKKEKKDKKDKKGKKKDKTRAINLDDPDELALRKQVS